MDEQSTQAMNPAEVEKALGPKTTTVQRATGAKVAADTRPKFHEWVDHWMADHLPTVEEKAATYGSNSLAKKGARHAAAQRIGVTNAEALEVGCDLYLIEKADRVEDAVMRGQLPGVDTLVDLAVYALMAQYIRDFGTWG